MNPQELTKQLQSIYNDNLESVILYGSAADGEFHKGISDYNMIVVLKEISPNELAKSNKAIKKWSKGGHPLPMIFTVQIIKDAADVFPIEFFDIIERRKILYGLDPFLDIKIDGKNLRHQCEHELRSKLLGLHPRIALLAGKPKDLQRLILESSSSFFALFRGILRLAGAKPKELKKELLAQLSKLINFNPNIFLEIIEVREGGRIWRENEVLEKFEQYLTSLDAVVKFIDKF
ncbi:MAG: nucleotidyltransferase domain-containing protein [Deltaproteobacteria bacterium]|nr:nucleotidyltransferase domain-containing protein [Deltaproteobacteria bacterium]